MVLMVMSGYCRPFSCVFVESTVPLVVDLTSLLFHNLLHFLLFLLFFLWQSSCCGQDQEVRAGKNAYL